MPSSPAASAAATNGNTGSNTTPPNTRGATFSPNSTRRFISGTDAPVNRINRSFECVAPRRQAIESRPNPDLDR
nr:hypothetical protein BJQ95_03723 [Cryobacterium sp. SO1]